MSLILLIFISSCTKTEMKIKNYKITFFDGGIEQKIYFTTDISNNISKVEYLDYIFDKNESYFNDSSFRFNFTKVSQKATVVNKNKEELSYILTDVPNDSLDVSTSLRTTTNYNLIEY